MIGFALRWDGPDVWISGDTVLYDGVRAVAERLEIATAMLHLGGVRFHVTGPLRYTLTAREAVELCRLMRPRAVIPIHYEGWSHFREGAGRDRARAGHRRRGHSRRFRWLPIGEPVDLG